MTKYTQSMWPIDLCHVAGSSGTGLLICFYPVRLTAFFDILLFPSVHSKMTNFVSV